MVQVYVLPLRKEDKHRVLGFVCLFVSHIFHMVVEEDAAGCFSAVNKET